MTGEDKVETATETLGVRDILIELLRRQPARAIAWKAMSSYITMAQMIELLTNSDETGLVWATDLLRVARDVIARRADSGAPLAPGKQLRAVLPDVRKVQSLNPLAQLAREEPNKVLWQDSTGSLTGAEMGLAIEEGTEAALQWVMQVFSQCEVFLLNGSKGKK
jgi:hypothetical protein